MEFKERKFESKEVEPFEADLRVDLVRHGKPSYTEEEVASGQVEGLLTPEGIEDFRKVAENLANSINKDKEIVVLWRSPRVRAQQSSEILEDVFEKKGISFLEKGQKRAGGAWEGEKNEERLRTKESLSDIKTSAEFMKVLKEGNIEEWWTYWLTAEKLPRGTESPSEVKKRVERFIAYLERIARTIEAPDEKKLHFICVGHEELFWDLSKVAYGMDPLTDGGPGYGESLRIDINKSTSEKDAVLNLKYKEKEAELSFNKEKRIFYKAEKE